jgi:YD repeat-containing protein
VFNRFGLHLSTLDLDTGAAKFNFTYSGHALYGKLLSVAERQRVLVNVQRDFHGRVELLQTAGDFSVRVKLNSFGNMRSLVAGDGRQYTFKYLSNTGLVTESVDAGGKEMLFSYNDNGKVNKVSWLGD